MTNTETRPNRGEMTVSTTLPLCRKCMLDIPDDCCCEEPQPMTLDDDHLAGCVAVDCGDCEAIWREREAEGGAKQT